MRGRRLSSAPSSVRRTTSARCAESRARSENQSRSGPTTASGSRPSCNVVSEMTKSGASARPCAVSISPRCAAMSASAPGRHPVEQHGERGAALLSGLQDVPRHGVGVSGGRRDEQPQVRGGEQLRREPPVRGHDRVDVGGVEEGEARVQRRRRDQLQRVVVRADAAGAGQLGQHAGVGEPAQVVGMADEHGGAGGGAQHPGRRDLLPDQAVHDRGLARSRGAADDGEQRCVEPAQAGEDVVVELLDELGARLACPLGPGDVELEADDGGGLAQGHEGVGEGAAGGGGGRLGRGRRHGQGGRRRRHVVGHGQDGLG